MSISFVLDSCMMGDAQSTPEFYASQMYRVHASGAQDTLRMVDSVNVGDTIRLPIVLSGQLNSLKSFVAQADDDAFKHWITCDSALLEFLTSASKPDKSILYFEPEKLVVASANFWFIPLKSGGNAITFTLANDANEQFSPRSFSFTPVVR